MNVHVGTDRDTGAPVYAPKASFDTHWHLIGGTGKGKTTAIHTILQDLLDDPTDADCWVIVDRMGNLSFDVLLWAVSDLAPPSLRDRLVYVEPAREDAVLGFNPLLYTTDQHGYYKVGRATDCMLRAWESQDIGQMPRLARWVFNSFWAAAQLGLTVADCGHLLNPGSDYHKLLVAALPPALRAEWVKILTAGGREVEVLDSTRNRLHPYFHAPVLRRMFGTAQSGLDVARFMREGKVVVLNLSSYNRLSPQLADAIGGLVVNEVLATARALPPWERHPTFLLLDEFQRFVGPDLEEAIPEVRQLGLKLILAHQSFAQLRRGDLDLTTMIFQAQSRLIFGLSGEDADLLAAELASLRYDPMRVKDEIRQRRQRLIGHRLTTLKSWSDSAAASENWSRNEGRSWAASSAKRYHDERFTRDETRGEAAARAEGGATGGGQTRGHVEGGREQLVPVHEEYEELASRTYFTFDEDLRVCGRDIRRLRTGEAFLRLVDDERVRSLLVRRSQVGHLALGPRELREDFPEALDAVEAFKEQNFASGLFRAPADIDRETEERLRRVLAPPITLQSAPAPSSGASPDAEEFAD